jgi:hypothetical protein
MLALQEDGEDDPPVWRKLLELCEERLLESEAKVKAKEVEVQDAQRQLQARRQQLAVQRQQLEEARAGNAEQEQHQVPHAGGSDE